MKRTTKDNRFRQWIRKNYKKDPDKLKPPELHDKYIVYLAWRQAKYNQPPNTEKPQQSHLDIN